MFKTTVAILGQGRTNLFLGPRMGGYASTPRKAKVSEEGGDETVHYAASGMQVIYNCTTDCHEQWIRLTADFFSLLT